MKPKTDIHTVKVRTRWFLTIPVLIWTIACGIMIGILTFGLITTPSRINDLIGAWLISITIFILAINYLTWQLIGRENVQITEDSIILYNSGTWFKRRLKIDFHEYEGIFYETHNRTHRWIQFWGLGGGRISFEYLGRARRFGQDLNNTRAKALTETLKKEIEIKNTNANNGYS
jgi:hypothetical protein